MSGVVVDHDTEILESHLVLRVRVASTQLNFQSIVDRHESITRSSLIGRHSYLTLR